MAKEKLTTVLQKMRDEMKDAMINEFAGKKLSMYHGCGVTPKQMSDFAGTWVQNYIQNNDQLLDLERKRLDGDCIKIDIDKSNGTIHVMVGHPPCEMFAKGEKDDEK